MSIIGLLLLVAIISASIVGVASARRSSRRRGAVESSAIPDPYCPMCGGAVPERSAFCPGCGQATQATTVHAGAVTTAGTLRQPETSTMAILAFVLVFFVSIAGIVLGYVALSEIRKSHGMKTGRGLALAAVIIGWVQVALCLALVIWVVVFAATTK